MLEILERKGRLHSQAAERIVAQWEAMWARSHRVDAIMKDVIPMDPTHQLDRFHTQLERENVPMDIAVNEELFDFLESQL